MKRYLLVLLGLFLLFNRLIVYSQTRNGMLKTAVIEPYPLAITFYKTTNLIFPYAVKSVDRGSRDVLVQKAKGMDNVLLVKAGRQNFEETNLSVITADGELYSFLLTYSPNPAWLNLSVAKDTAGISATLLLQPAQNEAVIEMIAKKLAGANRTIHGIKDKADGVRLRLNGLYIHQGVLYFQMEARNRSAIPYDIDMLRFIIKDEKKYKRTASQEIEVEPLYLYGDASGVKEQSKSILVFALPTFTIPDQKYLVIQVMEKNGGRHLQLKVRNRKIVEAKTVK